MGVALLFIDGVGIGRRDRSVNPLTRGEFLLSRYDDGTFTPLPARGVAYDVDTTFDVPGRPQSASNQTAILTGEPAPKLLGKHLLGFPNATLRKLISDRSIVKRLVDAGRTATFANSYPTDYLDALGLPHRAGKAHEVNIPERYRKRLRPSATTCAFAAANVPLRTLDDARAGEGLTNDVTGERGKSRGFDLPIRSPEDAAVVFEKLLRGHDFTLFEHYLADEAGHAQDHEAAEETLRHFDLFARAVIKGLRSQDHLLICSDHGNVEDLSQRQHTKNKVALLYFGAAPPEPSAVQTVADAGRLVLSLLGVTP